MKVQIDIDGDLWSKFKAKVHHEGKTLGSVVPTIFEPALRLYVEETIRDIPPAVPPVPLKNTCDKCGREITGIEWLRGDGMVKLCNDCMTVTEPTEEQKQAIQESANRGFQIVHPPTEKAYTEAAETFKEIAKPLPQPTPPTTTIETATMEFTGPTTEKKLVAVERLAPPPPTVKRCDLCDQVVDRLFASAGKRVCYTCWRAELTAGQ